MSELAARQTGTNLGQRSASQQVAQVPEPGKVTLTQNLYRRTHAVAQADSATTSAPPDPPSRTATWQQIADAADDPNAQAELDIAWIESLPAHIQESIDTAFADSKAAAKAARSAAPGLTKIEAEIRAAQKQLIRDTKLRLAQANQPSGGNDVARDPIYAAEFQRLELERDHRKQAHLKQIAQTQDSAVPMEQPKQSVARPETSTVKRLEGKSLARTNFMSWAVHVCGTADAAKAHFMSIKQVKGHPGMFLAGDARARFEAALADFDAHNPGYTIVGTTVAHAQRGRHQERWGVGMLGHALGESFDLRAYDNPNIKIDDKHSYAYLIAKFGGDGGKRGSGRATMSISESAIERTGQETVEGKRSTEGAALIDEVQRQFAEMSLTSERLIRSLENEMPRLQAARDMYFDQPSLLAELTQAQADHTRGDAVARKRLQDQVFSSPEEKLAAIGQIKQELAALVDEKADALAKSKATVQQALEHAFATWTAAIQIDIDADDAVLTENKSARTQLAEEQRTLSSIDAADADAVAQLEAFAASHDLTRPDDKKRVPENAKAYKKVLARELQRAVPRRARHWLRVMRTRMPTSKRSTSTRPSYWTPRLCSAKARKIPTDIGAHAIKLRRFHSCSFWRTAPCTTTLCQLQRWFERGRACSMPRSSSRSSSSGLRPELITVTPCTSISSKASTVPCPVAAARKT